MHICKIAAKSPVVTSFNRVTKSRLHCTQRSIPREQFGLLSTVLDIGNHYYDGRAYLTRFLQKQTLTHHLLSTSIVTHNFQQHSSKQWHYILEWPQLKNFRNRKITMQHLKWFQPTVRCHIRCFSSSIFCFVKMMSSNFQVKMV